MVISKKTTFYTSVTVIFDSLSRTNLSLIVSQIAWSGGELGVDLDDLVDGLQEIFFGGHLAAGADGKHTGFSTDRSDFGTSTVGTETSQEIVANVTFHTHLFGVDFEDVGTTFQVGQGEFDFTIQTARTDEGRVEGVGSVGGHENLKDKIK